MVAAYTNSTKKSSAKILWTWDSYLHNRKWKWNKHFEIRRPGDGDCAQNVHKLEQMLRKVQYLVLDCINVEKRRKKEKTRSAKRAKFLGSIHSKICWAKYCPTWAIFCPTVGSVCHLTDSGQNSAQHCWVMILPNIWWKLLPNTFAQQLYPIVRGICFHHLLGKPLATVGYSLPRISQVAYRPNSCVKNDQVVHYFAQQFVKPDLG